MELSIDPATAERIAWGIWGVLSFIALIAWCRWARTPEDQRELTPPEVPERRERQTGDQSVGCAAQPRIRRYNPRNVAAAALRATTIIPSGWNAYRGQIDEPICAYDEQSQGANQVDRSAHWSCPHFPVI